MNPIALWLASGESLYLGVGVLILVVGWSWWVRRRWVAWVRNFLAWVGLAMVVLACVPMAWWGYGVLAGVFGVWFAFCNLGRVGKWGWAGGVCSAVGLVGMLGVLVVSELPYREMRVVEGVRADHLVVIGESISAGIGGKTEPWPVVFERETGVRVVNLARPGIGTEEAVELAKKVSEGDSLVVIEIGGTDLLANVSGEEFGRELEKLVGRVDRPGRKLVMFELPLLPHKIEYGRVQRRVAREHGVVVVPKRFVSGVSGGEGATEDGVHLSGEGGGADGGVGEGGGGEGSGRERCGK